jgi:hypothetical protein
MSELSPAAQAVKDAVLALYSDEKVHKFGWQLDSPTVAAALRAAADQLKYKLLDVEVVDCSQLLLLADELEAQ